MNKRIDRLLTPAFLHQEYIVNNKSTGQISKEFQVHDETVRRRLIKCGIALRSQRDYAKNLIGKKFGEWRVIARAPHATSTGAQWVTRCSCGEERVTNANRLISGRSTCCGTCQHGNLNKNFHELPGAYWTSIQGHAKRRKISFLVTMEEAWALFLFQNRKCSLSGIELQFESNWRKNGKLQTASLDRIDSTKDYSIENLQWVHKDVNYMKNDLDQAQFVAWCQAVAAHTS